MREDMSFKTPGSVLAGEKLENPSRFRARLCLCLLLAGFAAVGVKLAMIQLINHEFWVNYVDDQRKSAITIYPKRGTIYDCNMKPLATSVVQEVLCVAPPYVTDVVELAKAISPYAKIPPQKIVNKICSTKLQLVYLRRGLDVKTAKEISAKKLSGVEFRSENSRHYPNGSHASNIIGFANLENKGLAGIEYKYDAHLAGEAGKEIVIKDNSRREIVALARTVKEARDGGSIVLTIDEYIQHTTEKALDGIVRSFSPESASAVVLEPGTGRVLAMASRPTFDPNKPSTYKSERLRNRVITDAFEPGSAFKPIAAAAALEQNVVSPGERVYCEMGSMRYHGHTYNDVHPIGDVPFYEVMAQSSNIGMIKVVNRLSPEYFYDLIKGFGFGNLTGIDLPGESPGIVHPPARWSRLSMGSLPIGQEIAVTTLQLATAYSAIANGGKLMRPYTVSKILSPEGEILIEKDPEVVRQVIRPKTAKILREMLERVVDSGTGTAAKINGYRCAGKTGTAQKANPVAGGYYRDKYVAVFAGFLPADNPAVCIVIAVDSPQGKYYGGQVAAPAFREIGRELMNHLEIAPTEFEDQADPEPRHPAEEKNKPAPEEHEDRLILAGDDGLPFMPDVKGMTMKEILELMSEYSISFEFEGSGVAFKQNPGAGQKLENGQRCQIAFERIGGK
jgi:cell division protein FtsI (penicillin-binding protein 3)